jgi:hypothetical protein
MSAAAVMLKERRTNLHGAKVETNMLTDTISSIIDLGIAPARAVVEISDSPIVVPAVPATPAIDAAIDNTLAERDAAARAAASEAGGVLARIIAHGQKSAARTIERILNEVPTDAVVGNKRMAWNLAGTGDNAKVVLTTEGAFDGKPLPMHRHALQQAVERMGVPIKYLDRLTEGAQWERDLARDTLNTHSQNKAGKAMLRVYGGQVRGFLSDAYKRIDSRPMLDSLLGALSSVGFVVYAGVASDVRVSVRAIKPQIYEVAGDPVVFGIEWDNSDYGAGKHEVRVFLLRTLCLNGMTGESLMSNTHLGSRASEDVKLSEQTRKAGEEYFTGLIRETVTQRAGQAAIDKTLAAVRQSAEERISLGDNLPTALRRALSKPEQDRVKALFESDESVMLPPAPTTARLANVLSWMANTSSNPDRALDLQALAGEVMGI